jgi:hypothetical protein
MKRSDLARLGAALYAATVVTIALPGVVGAQASGTAPQPGVTSSTGLPRTGNPEATTAPTPGPAPFVLIAGGAVVGLYALRRRWVHYVVPRKRQ